MVRRSFRVPITAFFDRKDKRRINAPLFEALFATNGLSHHRLGAIVSALVSKSAVRRHMIKREMLNIFPSPVTLGLDIVFIAHKATADRTRQELRVALREIWAKMLP